MTRPTVTGRASIVESTMYKDRSVTTTQTLAPAPAGESVFKNAFDCILTRSMIDYGGNIPLDVYL